MSPIAIMGAGLRIAVLWFSGVLDSTHGTSYHNNYPTPRRTCAQRGKVIGYNIMSVQCKINDKNTKKAAIKAMKRDLHESTTFTIPAGHSVKPLLLLQIKPVFPTEFVWSSRLAPCTSSTIQSQLTAMNYV